MRGTFARAQIDTHLGELIDIAQLWAYADSMTKSAQNPSYSPVMTTITLPNGRGPQRTVTFGNVTVTGDEPSAESVAESLAISRRAMEGLARALAKPGIRLPEKKNVPQFWVDDNDTSILIRRLNKKTERGRFVDNEFQVID
jgi:hypothetical protein